MVLKPHFLLFIKYGFLSTIVTSAGFLIFYTTDLNWIKDDSAFYNNPEQVLGAPFRELDPNFAECVTDPSKVFCLVSANERLNMIAKRQSEVPVSSLEARAQRKHPIHALLEDFCQVAQSLGVTPILIEPSILFCMVSETQKLLLLRRGLNLARMKGSERVITLAVMRSDSDILDDEHANAVFQSASFEPSIVHEPVGKWLKAWTKPNISTHLFYKRKQLLVHVVVFYERSNYLWHAALKESDIPLQEFEDLMFMEADSAYESFTPYLLSNESLTSVHIPSNPQYFLFEIGVSKFMECNLSRAALIPAGSDRTTARFQRRTLSAIRELKFRLSGPLIRFWIFSGTLLGWYRQCGIIPYTTDVDLAAWISDLDNLEDILKHLYDNKRLKLVERMGIMEEGLEFRLDSFGLRVDLFFMYKDSDRTWIAVHKPSQNLYMRMYYPTFNVCSADLLGEKVHAPCESEEIIVTEYGPDWQLPISEWLYDKSPFNLDERRFWNESQKTEAYKSYR